MRTFLATYILFLSCVMVSAAETKPNVIFILADDLGWTDLGCQGSQYYLTPNIDKLAANGLRLTSAYTCGPNCQPTRAALMTGQYGPRTGVYTVGNIDRFDWKSRPLKPVDNVVQLPKDRKTLGDMMTTAGYKTALFGKWHLGETNQLHPANRGFGESFVTMGKHFDFVTNPKMDIPKGTYLADFLTDQAIAFIEKNKTQPFYLHLHHFGVHSPFQAKPELIEKFKKRTKADGHDDPIYAAMIASVDESVGRIIAKLDELKLSENTLVIFTSDNGGIGGYARDGIITGKDPTDNFPLRAGKGTLYEGGVRVPWIVRWPGTVPAGKINDTPIISVDLMPTMIELGKVIEPMKNQPLDGVSLMSLFKTGRGDNIPTRDLFWHFPGYLGAGQGTFRTTPAGAIRSGDYKMIEFFETGKRELYNLKNDISQKTNLAEKEPFKVQELAAKLIVWRNDVKAPMPSKNEAKKK